MIKLNLSYNRIRYLFIIYGTVDKHCSKNRKAKGFL